MNSRFPALPQNAFTASDVVALYLHRGAFENALADEDQEQDPDRWVSHTANGQEVWQIVSQWLWNLRLELGHVLEPTEIRSTLFAPALPPAHKETSAQAPVQGYGSAEVALRRTRGPLLWARLRPPARWDLALSGQAVPRGA